jgi:membrane glycosyltransferase
VGKWFRAKRLLSTPEEIEPPQILTAAAAAREQYEAALKEVWDVRMLLDKPELMALHMQLMDKLPTHVPGGKIESMDAIARVKVQEAQTQEALLANLDNKELGYILGNPLLLQTMQRLPKSYTESDLVSIC